MFGRITEVADRRIDMKRLIVNGTQVRSETRIHFEVLIDDWSSENTRPATPAGPCIVPSVPGKIGSVINSDETENYR